MALIGSVERRRPLGDQHCCIDQSIRERVVNVMDCASTVSANIVITTATMMVLQSEATVGLSW